MKEHFTFIHSVASFAKIFKDEISDDQRLHLVVTAHEPYSQTGGNHEETSDVVGELPPQRCAFLVNLLFVALLTCFSA